MIQSVGDCKKERRKRDKERVRKRGINIKEGIMLTINVYARKGEKEGTDRHTRKRINGEISWPQQ